MLANDTCPCTGIDCRDPWWFRICRFILDEFFLNHYEFNLDWILCKLNLACNDNPFQSHVFEKRFFIEMAVRIYLACRKNPKLPRSKPDCGCGPFLWGILSMFFCIYSLNFSTFVSNDFECTSCVSIETGHRPVKFKSISRFFIWIWMYGDIGSNSSNR